MAATFGQYGNKIKGGDAAAGTRDDAQIQRDEVLCRRLLGDAEGVPDARAAHYPVPRAFAVLDVPAALAHLACGSKRIQGRECFSVRA
jgi:hypothetical protein